jgi:formylglycine-generating enzyme required for sulfatase activity
VRSKARSISKRRRSDEPTLSVAHEALFRVWDRLREWLLQERRALALRSQIEKAAHEWADEGRAESLRWPEERIMDAAREIECSAVSLDNLADSETMRAFLGPIDLDTLLRLPALGADWNVTQGSGQYGEPWRLPLDHEARASVGVRLALLNDPRSGVGLDKNGVPSVKWIKIPAGEVTIEIRSDASNPNSEIISTLSRPVNSFWIARYPITVSQFQAVVQICRSKGVLPLPPSAPEDVKNTYRSPKHRAKYANHPADSVNWWDAVGFCHWVGESLGYVVRLPTEFEWQLAAIGDKIASNTTSGYLYPWGPAWDPEREPWRANTVESELGRPTAVGMYPAGASAAGVLDLTGTLWEWCLNQFEDPDFIGSPSDDTDRRTVRGGAWDRGKDHARSSYRDQNSPRFRFGGIGFRVACECLDR